MSYIFRMPAVGEGITEGEIVSWSISVGDSVVEDDTLLEIQNDKLVQDVPSPIAGTLTKILVEEGTVANVGDALAEFDAPGYENTEALTEAPESTTSTPESPAMEAKAEAAASSNYVVHLPNVGEGITEGEIVSWAVEVGDTIEADATLLEVQNDKLVQDVPSPVTGVIQKILVEAGVVANVGDAIVEIAVEGHVSSEASPATSTATTSEAPKAEASGVTGSSMVGDIVLAMPSVRQYARDKGIEITEVSGTGRHGHITISDVDAFTSAPQAEAAAPAAKAATVEKTKIAAPKAQAVAQTDGTTREKMTPTRRAIAKAMVNSKAHAPHVTLFEEVEVSKLMDHRKKFKDVAAKQDIKLTFLAYMSKAVVSVLRKYPLLNSSVDETTDEIVYKNYFNLGIAVDTENGLYVPNIKDADRKGIFTIAQEITELATKAHDGTLTGPEMRDGSSTISNIGSAWGLWFTPIINYPEVAIFGMGRIEKKPVVLEDGTLGVGSVLHLSMSFDHRIIDGAYAQNAMNELKRLLADPELLLMEG